jgi:hypothetical protein
MKLDQHPPVARALLVAFCGQLGYDPDHVVRITMLADFVVVDLAMPGDGRWVEWTEKRPVADWTCAP